MRIAFISWEFPPRTGKGGIGTYVNQVAKAMAGMDWDVHVFAGSYNETGSEYTEGYYVHLVKCKDGDEFRNAVIESFDLEHSASSFDIIESPEINGNAWEIKKKYPSIPLVVRLHAPGYLVEHLKKKYIPFFAKLRFVLGSIRRLKFDLGYWRVYNKNEDADYRFIRLADYITAPSNAMKQWAVENWQIAENKITVIPNIFLPPQALLNIPVLKNTVYKRIIFFGRLNVLKGLVNAGIAMRNILKKNPNWKFRLIGDDGPGPTHKIKMRSWLKLQLKAVIGQVEFIDGIEYEELPGMIAESEIVLLPSLFESFSYTCAEAMAAGKVVVGSKIGGMADLLDGGKAGLLIDPYKPVEIERAIDDLISDEPSRITYSQIARKRIELLYNSSKTGTELEKYYLSLLPSHEMK
ncbi:MAG: glycosyltransferase family 4 protein [Ginsengibacter sp.]